MLTRTIRYIPLVAVALALLVEMQAQTPSALHDGKVRATQIDAAKNYAGAGDLKSAIEMLDAISAEPSGTISHDIENAKNLIAIANALKQGLDYRHATATLGVAVQLLSTTDAKHIAASPRQRADMLSTVGSIYECMWHDLPRAEQYYTSAIDADPTFSAAHTALKRVKMLQAARTVTLGTHS